MQERTVPLLFNYLITALSEEKKFIKLRKKSSHCTFTSVLPGFGPYIHNLVKKSISIFSTEPKKSGFAPNNVG